MTSYEIRSTDKVSLVAIKKHDHWYALIEFTNAEELSLEDLDFVDVSIDDASFSRKHPNLKLAVIVNKPHIKEKADEISYGVMGTEF